MTLPLRTLIVEDEAVLAMQLESLLTDAGHEVVGWALTAGLRVTVRYLEQGVQRPHRRGRCLRG